MVSPRPGVNPNSHNAVTHEHLAARGRIRCDRLAAMAETHTARQHFASGTTALRRRDPERARAHFRGAYALASPLVAAHAVRGLAQAALQEGDTERALALLAAGREAYALAETLEPVVAPGEASTDAIALDAREGQATCLIMEVDVHYTAGRYELAQAALDKAYPLYRSLEDRPSQADLWTATARLAQHDQRWLVAGSAWKKVIKIAEKHKQNPQRCRAWLRLAEVRLLDADLESAENCIDHAEPIARDLEDPELLGRMWSAKAALAAQRDDLDAAWDMGLDAIDALSRSHEVRLLHITRLRMAQLAARTRPAEAVPLLREVLDAERDKPTSPLLASVAQKAADLALRRQRHDVALIAARAEEGLAAHPHDARLRQVRALLALGEDEAAAWLAHYEARTVGESMPALAAMATALGDAFPQILAASYERLATEAMPQRDAVVVRVARQRGLPLEHLSTARGLERVLDLLMQRAGTLAVASPEATVDTAPVLRWSDALGQEQRLEVPMGVTTIGRGRSNTIQIAWDPAIARSHVSLMRSGKTLRLQDLASENGTFVADKQVDSAVLLEGDRFRVGETEFEVELRKSATAAIAPNAIAVASAAAAVAP